MLSGGGQLPVGLAPHGYGIVGKGILRQCAYRGRIGAEGGEKLAAHDVGLVGNTRHSEFHLLQIEFVAGHIAVQRHALGIALPHQFYLFLGECFVGGIHLRLILQVVQLQEKAREEELHATSLVGGVDVLHRGVLSCKLYARRNGSAGIHHLLRLKQEIVAIVRHRRASALPEVAVPESGVAQI